MKGALTDLDLRIIEALRRDARTSFRALAKRLGVSTPTVSKRVKRLEAAGIIRGYTVVTPELPGATEGRGPEPLLCALCRNRVEGRPRIRKLGDTTRVFCCDFCASAYVDRFGRFVPPRKLALGLAGAEAAVALAFLALSCGSSVCPDGPGMKPLLARCPPWAAPQPEFAAQRGRLASHFLEPGGAARGCAARGANPVSGPCASSSTSSRP